MKVSALATLFLLCNLALAAASSSSSSSRFSSSEKTFNDHVIKQRRELANQRRAARNGGGSFEVDSSDLSKLPSDIRDLFEAAAAKAALDALEGDDDDDSQTSSSSSSSSDDDDDSSSSDDDSSSSSDDDDSSSSSTSSSVDDRRDLRDARRIAELIAAQAAAELNPFPELKNADRASYQARFIGGLSPRDTNLTNPFLYGSTVIFSKTTSNNIAIDSFDGDQDGFLDVAAALKEWAADLGPADDSRANLVRIVRNRATVNGGSIGLTGITLTPNGISFDKLRLSISPCFPIVFQENFNLEMYVNVHGNESGLADEGSPALLVIRNPECQYPAGHSQAGERIPGRVCEPTLSGREFWDVQPDGTVDFTERTATFTLERLQFDTVNFPDFDQEANAEVYFERCTQFSYFA
jgi:hypothetical protein